MAPLLPPPVPFHPPFLPGSWEELVTEPAESCVQSVGEGNAKSHVEVHLSSERERVANTIRLWRE